MEIKRYDNFGHSPAWELVGECQAELTRRGLNFPRNYSPVWNDAAFVAFDDRGRPVGFMAYRHNQPAADWYILLAYVIPAHRGMDIHTSMFKALVERAKLHGDILTISAGTHVKNEIAQKAFEKQGRSLVSLGYVYTIKDFAPAHPTDKLDK